MRRLIVCAKLGDHGTAGSHFARDARRQQPLAL
jgi:hypothetical protein